MAYLSLHILICNSINELINEGMNFHDVSFDNTRESLQPFCGSFSAVSMPEFMITGDHLSNPFAEIMELIYFTNRPRNANFPFSSQGFCGCSNLCVAFFVFCFSALEVVRSTVATVDLTLVTRTDSVFLLCEA